jgi:hypothetical protein
VRSISTDRGSEGWAPARVQHRLAATPARHRASRNGAPRCRAAAKTPQKQSPAAVVSTAQMARRWEGESPTVRREGFETAGGQGHDHRESRIGGQFGQSFAHGPHGVSIGQELFGFDLVDHQKVPAPQDLVGSRTGGCEVQQDPCPRRLARPMSAQFSA